MSHPYNANLTLNLLATHPMVVSMMTYSVGMALCLDLADALAQRDASYVFPVKKK